MTTKPTAGDWPTPTRLDLSGAWRSWGSEAIDIGRRALLEKVSEPAMRVFVRGLFKRAFALLHLEAELCLDERFPSLEVVDAEFEDEGPVQTFGQEAGRSNVVDFEGYVRSVATAEPPGS